MLLLWMVRAVWRENLMWCHELLIFHHAAQVLLELGLHLMLIHLVLLLLLLTVAGAQELHAHVVVVHVACRVVWQLSRRFFISHLLLQVLKMLLMLKQAQMLLHVHLMLLLLLLGRTLR